MEPGEVSPAEPEGLDFTKSQGSEWKPEIQGKDISRYGYTAPTDTYVKYGKHVAGYVATKFFTSPRILIMEVTRGDAYKLSCAYVTEEYYNTPSIINVIHPQNDTQQLLFVLCLMNSRLFTWYHKKVHPKANATTSIPKILVGDVRKLPIIQTTIANQQKAANIAERMIKLHREAQENIERFITLIRTEYGLTRYGKRLDSFWELDYAQFITKAGLSKLSVAQKDDLLKVFEKYSSILCSIYKEISAIDSAIDEMVFDLYKLTPEERAIITGTAV